MALGSIFIKPDNGKGTREYYSVVPKVGNAHVDGRGIVDC